MYKTTTTRFGKSCTNSLISHRFVAALPKAYYRGFLLPEQRGSLRKFNVGTVAVRGLSLSGITYWRVGHYEECTNSSCCNTIGSQLSEFHSYLDGSVI